MTVLGSALLPLLLLLLSVPSPGTALNCMQEGDPLETRPREINTTPGKDFRLQCMVDGEHPSTQGVSAYDLYFTRDYMTHQEQIPSSQYKVVNNTLEVVDRLERPVHHQYTCRVRSSRPVCFSSVNIGYPPLNALNFSCISNNWENLTCKWMFPYNAVRTSYRLMYRVGDNNPELDKRREQWAVCPLYKQLDNSHASCSMTGTSQPVYRHGKEWFNFTMNITNAFGNQLQVLGRVHHFAVVLPNAPAWVKSSKISTRSLQLETLIDYPMSEFPIPLQFRITSTSPWNDSPTLVNTTIQTDQRSPELPRYGSISGLLPYTVYQFQVQVRSSAARREDMWSQPALHTVRTLPTIPDAAPRVDVGSFQLVDGKDSRTVYLYWRQIAGWQKNGPDFTYCARALPAGAAGATLVPELTTAAYAKFTGVPLNQTVLLVQACNRVGVSLNTAQLVVPDRRQIGAPPFSVTLLIIGSGHYRLIWHHETKTATSPESFTVFWCRQRSNRRYQCEGQLDMTRVAGDLHQYNLSLATDHQYQFAVAANYRAPDGSLQSSGMTWSRCSLLASIDAQQVVEPSVNEYGPDYITLTWNNDCSSQAADVVSKFVVYVCPQVDGICIEQEQRRELTGPISSGLRVDRLRPFTNYRLSVALVTGGREGPRSAPKDTRTMEAMPATAPTVTEVAAVSNTSLIVRWSPPVQPNGVLRRYLVYVSGREYSVQDPNTHKLLVQKLQPYTEYIISLQACNRAGCSGRSPPVQGRTLPGVPGRMSPVRSQLLNTSAVLLQWQPPVPAGGPKPLYQLRMVSEDAGHNYTSTILLPEDALQTEQEVRLCQPGVASQRNLFWVRAATLLPSGERLEGPWSAPTQQNCVLAADWSAVRLLGVVVGGCLAMVLAALVFFCLCSRTKRKWVKMRDIGVNLPSGLDRQEKPPLSALGGGANASGEYHRLVSSPNHDTTRVTPVLRDSALSSNAQSYGHGPVDAVDCSTLGGRDSNSCASSATTSTDSGTDLAKVGSPTSEITPWASNDLKLAPYIQVGCADPSTLSSDSAKYSKFSPYVDAAAIRTLMARPEISLEPNSRSEPDLTSDVSSQLPYTSHLGHGSSTGYVSMTLQDGLATCGSTLQYQRRTQVAPPQTPPAPAVYQVRPLMDKTSHLEPYIYLDLPPATAAISTASRFPSYVLAGLPECESGPGPEGQDSGPGGQNSGPDLGHCEVRRPADRVTADGGYVTHDNLWQPAIELKHLSSTDDESEPMLSPKKLATVVSAHKPYYRVVTSQPTGAELGPSVSMV